jgi:hypothetical protein
MAREVYSPVLSALTIFPPFWSRDAIKAISLVPTLNHKANDIPLDEKSEQFCRFAGRDDRKEEKTKAY